MNPRQVVLSLMVAFVLHQDDATRLAIAKLARDAPFRGAKLLAQPFARDDGHLFSLSQV